MSAPTIVQKLFKIDKLDPVPAPAPAVKTRPAAAPADGAPAGPAVAAAPAHDRAGRGGVGGGAAAAAGGHPAPPHQRAHPGGRVGGLHRGGDITQEAAAVMISLCAGPRGSRLQPRPPSSADPGPVQPGAGRHRGQYSSSASVVVLYRMSRPLPGLMVLVLMISFFR